jgi:ParB-like chromosome segregation protein Spo0J
MSPVPKPIEFHEAANIFPLDDENLETLASDIKENEQKIAIEILDGKIIDGRRRWLACKQAGVEPWTVTVRKEDIGDPIAYVMSLNLHRRHLTVSQASMCAARADGLTAKLAEEAKERLSQAGKAGREKQLGGVPKCAQAQNTGKTRDKLAEQFGVSHGSVDRARRVIATENEELIAAVDKGEVPVAKAASIAANPPELHAPLLDAAKSSGGKTSPKSEPKKSSDTTGKPQGELQGVGIKHANEAINCLSRIPKSDGLRKRGFQLVSDWIKANK